MSFREILMPKEIVYKALTDEEKRKNEELYFSKRNVERREKLAERFPWNSIKVPKKIKEV